MSSLPIPEEEEFSLDEEELGEELPFPPKERLSPGCWAKVSPVPGRIPGDIPDAILTHNNSLQIQRVAKISGLSSLET